MLYFLEDFLESAIPGVILLLVIYGVFRFVKFSYRKIKLEITGTENGKLTVEQKKKILNVIKIFGGTQVIGLLFYATPVINENIKILISVLIMLIGFILAFFMKENSNESVSRTLVFLGQEFFGITMILLMVNKGLGYSVCNIFVIWSAFNFFIYKQAKNIENKVFFIGTVLIAVFSLISDFAYELEILPLIVGLAITSLGIHLFGNKDSLLLKFLHNLVLTVMTIIVLLAIGNAQDNQLLIFITVFIYMAVIMIEKVINDNFNLRSLLVYVPYVVLLMMSEFKTELLFLVTVFFMMMAIWLLSDKSSYRKWLSVITIFITVGMTINYISIDETIGGIIYISSILFAFSYLFVPTEERITDEGSEENE